MSSRVFLSTDLCWEVSMKNVSFLKWVSRLLVFSMLWLSFQSANAAIVPTDQALAAPAQAQADRQRVHDFVSRADVAQQLQALGIRADIAKQRVDALTDEEVQRIAGKLDTLPAGAASDWAIAAAVIVIALVIWWAWK
jgi:hypothetical protein